MYPVTERKLREARFFLRKLQEKAQTVVGDPEEFGFFLSALLSAGRSVTFALQVENKDGYDAWFPVWLEKQNQEDQDLFKFMNNQRVKEVHQGGADVDKQVEFIPLTEIRPTNREHPAYGFHWFGPPGIDPPKIGRTAHYFELGGSKQEVAAGCLRYFTLVEQLVQEFVKAHPHGAA